ncbi:MAG TPA: hypothetical protein DDY22_18520 [Geobacter sp.]|nr:hypothetical protein [Geobacter sp.]HIH30380.1 hypothetical protein [Candidatus Micrarchaeota archaeon]
MRIENVLSAKGLAFLLLFTAIALAASSLNFSQVLGAENQSFTFFQFMGPIAGGFLGAGAGVLSVFLAQIISFIYLGKAPELINIIRLAPMLFAALYFAKYSKGKLWQAAVPLACMALFMLHPVGSQAWFYSLYWLIPAIVLLLPENLFLRSLGSTFAAHSIGGIIWLYFIPTTPEFWAALIPIVAFERLLFALGISGSYIAFNTVLSRFEAVAKSGLVAIDRRYVLLAEGN